MDTIIAKLEDIGFIGVILIWMSYLIGMKFPDWDFKMKLKHRNILTHSPLILFLMIYFYEKQKNVEIFRFVIMGFSFAIGIHMIFDFFPRGWSRGALIHFPFCRMCLKAQSSKYFIFFSAITGIFLSIKYSKNYLEVILLIVLGVYTLVKHMKKEEKFFRPFSIFFPTMVMLSAIKYKEISDGIYYFVHLISEKIKILF